MEKEHLKYHSNDGATEIHAVCWIPEGEIKAILQISHGMVEYIERYDEFACYLGKQGVLVVGNDHLGHGKSVRSKEYYGYFAEKEGNTVLLKDIHRLRLLMQKRYPGIPYFLLGHSMGSFLARQYLCIYGEGLSGAVIMGTGYQPWIATEFGMILTKSMAAFLGWEHRSRLVDSLGCGGYNRKFGTPQGKEWLSRDEENVKKYSQDELCSFVFTLNGYYNLFYSINMLSYDRYLKRMPKELPVFFVAGEEDPVGQFGKGVYKVADRFRRIGMKHVDCKLYPEDRHEILNEVDRQQVFEDIGKWIRSQLA